MEQMLWEHLEKIITIAILVIGSIYVPIRNRRVERKEKEQQQVFNAIWKKLDKLTEDLSNNYYTKTDCDSKIKHRIEKATMKQTIERLKDESPHNQKDR
ncbi:hypothetical protein CL622_01860 [archaeon]|nr:hypothetical protein [archaeon]